MPRAQWRGTVLAEADEGLVERVEGNVYFPPETVRKELLRESRTQTVCPWKGTAHYYDVVVGEAINQDAAWYYPDPRPAAAEIAGRIALWKGVDVR